MSKKKNQKSKDLKQVKDHYLDYPYPFRDPEEDKKRLLKMYGDFLGEINHWLFNGKENFKKGFRILVAGGGTGDSTIYLAEQLKDTDAEIIYLDFSKNSMKLAQERAKNRGLKNIKWINDSIFNLPNLKLGKFDYIQCSGVLHHLESPDEGLKTLVDALSDRGGMNIMVYAQYGRTGVYQIQDLMRRVNKGVKERADEVKNAWKIMEALPQTNWYSRGKDLLADHIYHGDVGMYDMFLHKQDRAYTVPEIYEFVEKAGMNFIEFNSAHSRYVLNIENYIQDSDLLKRLKKLDKAEQHAICELMAGSIIKHSFYISKKKKTVAKFTDMDNVPYFYTILDVPENVSEYVKKNQHLIGGKMSFSWKSDLLGDTKVSLPISKYTEAFFRGMIGNKRSFKDLQEYISKEIGKKVSDSEFAAEINRILPIFEHVGVVLLRKKGVDIPSRM
ncbi:MAG: class I SAM-dependent methyltransferase [Pseudomonadota bacterium]